MTKLFSTPLTSWHEEHGAKMAPFAGWNMPIQYSGIIAEHIHTREKASIFDICHMGEFSLRGKDIENSLGKAVTHDLATLRPGRCRYGFLLTDRGTVLDDLIIYCHSKEHYMLVVNAACEKSDFQILRERLPSSFSLENISSRTAKIDVQGPESLLVLNDILPAQGMENLPYFGFATAKFQNIHVLVSRTGYTGERGFEIYIPSEHALAFWEKICAHPLAKPAGLGARDTLRLEAGLPLYGHELDDAHTPVEAGLGNFMKSGASYTGKDSIGNVQEILVPLLLDGRRSARNMDKVFSGGNHVGFITSGSFAPSLGRSIAFAYVSKEFSTDTNFTVKGQNAELTATRTNLPFYKKGTARLPLQG